MISEKLFNNKCKLLYKIYKTNFNYLSKIWNLMQFFLKKFNSSKTIIDNKSKNK